MWMGREHRKDGEERILKPVTSVAVCRMLGQLGTTHEAGLTPPMDVLTTG